MAVVSGEGPDFSSQLHCADTQSTPGALPSRLAPQKYIDAIRNDLQQIKRMMLAQNATLSKAALKAVEEYEAAFARYVSLQHWYDR